MTTQTPMTDAFLIEGGAYTYEALVSHAQKLERALTAEREKNAKLREEVLEEAAKRADAKGIAIMSGAELRAMKGKQ